MSLDLFATLRSLSDASATSGDETEVRKIIKAQIRDHVDSLDVDALGNLITLKRGTGGSDFRVLVTAHMDEVGLMVVGYTGEGCLRVHTTGGINAQLLPGLSVAVGQGRLPGVIGVKPIHLAKSSARSKVPAVDSLAVDIGANGKDEAKRLAPVGTRATFTTRFRDLGASATGKAFDDRAGCAVLMALLQDTPLDDEAAPEPLPFDLYGVFTVQEEVGLRGARVAAYTVDPDVGFALECTIADDLPKREEDVSPTTELGKGPALTVMDRSYTAMPRLLSHVIQSAEAEGIPYQIKQPGISGTEAGGIHAARGGVPAITIATPCRYIHSPISLLRRTDLENTLRLIRATLRRLTPETLSHT